MRCRHAADQIRKHVAKCDHRPGDDHDDHRAVFDVVACAEGVVPMIEKLGHISPDTERQDQHRTDLNQFSPHSSFDAFFLDRGRTQNAI